MIPQQTPEQVFYSLIGTAIALLIIMTINLIIGVIIENKNDKRNN